MKYSAILNIKIKEKERLNEEIRQVQCKMIPNYIKIKMARITPMIKELFSGDIPDFYSEWTFIDNNNRAKRELDINGNKIFPMVIFVFNPNKRIIIDPISLWNPFFKKFEFVTPKDVEDAFLDYFKIEHSITGYEIKCH